MCLIPLARAYILDEPTALLLVAEIAVVKIAGIPVDQHAAEIEYDVFYHNSKFIILITRAKGLRPPQGTAENYCDILTNASR